MTVGRSGSTALMYALRKQPDLATPGKNIDCVDDELLHPDFVAQYASGYRRLTAADIGTPDQLVEAFFDFNAGAAFAGFKSMPNRHRDFAAFVRTPGLTVISLVRDDIPSTVASFLLATATGCWRRGGGSQSRSLRFDPRRHGPFVAANLRYVNDGIKRIAAIPGAITLTYEALCRPDFRSPELDAYFGRAVRLENPKPPLHGSSYIENWPEFQRFLQQQGETAA
jgi:hypothetical protein